jgi:hypothetical protein
MSKLNESFTVSMSSKNTTLTSSYFPKINFHKNSEIALLCLQTYNKFPDVNETNNCIRIIIPKPCHHILDIVLPIRCYEIEDMPQFIYGKIYDDNEHYLKSDIRYTPTGFSMGPKMSFLKYKVSKMSCVINCNCKIDFTIENNLASILGFKNKIYGKGDYLSGFISERNININAVNSIKFLCNITNGSFNNGLQSHSIY